MASVALTRRNPRFDTRESQTLDQRQLTTLHRLVAKQSNIFEIFSFHGMTHRHLNCIFYLNCSNWTRPVLYSWAATSSLSLNWNSGSVIDLQKSYSLLHHSQCWWAFRRIDNECSTMVCFWVRLAHYCTIDCISLPYRYRWTVQAVGRELSSNGKGITGTYDK